MELTRDQLSMLQAAIFAETDPDFVNARAINNDDEMAAFYNKETTQYAWRNFVTRQEYQDDDAFNWTQVDNLTTGSKFRIWEWMFDNDRQAINPSKSNIRAGIAACWVGNAQLLAVQAAILTRSKRLMLRGENLFATGGTGSVASPKTMPIEGNITAQNISDARNLG